MKYIYKYNYATIPRDFKLFPLINLAAESLHKKLIQIDLKQLGISEYNQRYLSEKLANPIGSMQLYSYLLALSLIGNKFPLNRFVFVDYGGGSGCLSLLAKEMGIGRVIYNDIYDVSCNDVKILARATNIDVDDYVCGDIDELINYLKKQSLPINAISSYDVIEHIYDIKSYIKKLRFLSYSSFRVIFGSSANIKNPRIRWKLRKIHLEREYKDRETKWGHKDRDTLNSFLNIRKEIINKYDLKLPLKTTEEIAKSTRGLMKQDIEKCVDEYKTKGEILYKPDHPTNTCDPYTGNWAEHLMELKWLENIFKDEGFEVKILNGYYAYSEFIYKRLIKNTLNIGIKYFGKTALFFSPYYIVYADYNV